MYVYNVHVLKCLDYLQISISVAPIQYARGGGGQESRGGGGGQVTGGSSPTDNFQIF